MKAWIVLEIVSGGLLVLVGTFIGLYKEDYARGTFWIALGCSFFLFAIGIAINEL